MAIGRGSGLNTLCHSYGFACQQTVLKTFLGPGSGYLRSESGVVSLQPGYSYIYIYIYIFIIYTYIYYMYVYYIHMIYIYMYLCILYIYIYIFFFWRKLTKHKTAGKGWRPFLFFSHSHSLPNIQTFIYTFAGEMITSYFQFRCM